MFQGFSVSGPWLVSSVDMLLIDCKSWFDDYAQLSQQISFLDKLMAAAFARS
jgi:hypothetical protein